MRVATCTEVVGVLQTLSLVIRDLRVVMLLRLRFFLFLFFFFRFAARDLLAGHVVW
jgi:hypothetical protein